MTVQYLGRALGVLAMSLATRAWGHDEAPAPPGPLTEPHALVLSGGVSLGAYEAGLNWALVTHMRRSADRPPARRARRAPRLVALTGASAGSINAVLSALEWCAPDTGTLTDNLFHHTWTTVGLENLLPSKPGGYYEDDGLFSRKALDESIARLKCRARGRVYEGSGRCGDDRRPLRAGCEVSIGIMVSRIRPISTAVNQLATQTQRFVVPLRLVTTADGEARFRAERLTVDPFVGNPIYLPESRADGTVSLDRVIDLLLTSSAFPVAFGPRTLTYCASDGRTDAVDPFALQKEGLRCPGDGLRPYESGFVDGGVFDNVPLGVARALAERASGEADGVPSVHYVYIDPDRRRGVLVPSELGEADEVRIGLRPQLRFVRGFIQTARNYELQSVLRFGDWHETLRSLARKVGPAARGACDRLLMASHPAGSRWPGRTATRGVPSGT
jgi:hypothetical protein